MQCTWVVAVVAGVVAVVCPQLTLAGEENSTDNEPLCCGHSIQLAAAPKVTGGRRRPNVRDHRTESGAADARPARGPDASRRYRPAGNNAGQKEKLNPNSLHQNARFLNYLQAEVKKYNVRLTPGAVQKINETKDGVKLYVAVNKSGVITGWGFTDRDGQMMLDPTKGRLARAVPYQSKQQTRTVKDCYNEWEDCFSDCKWDGLLGALRGALTGSIRGPGGALLGLVIRGLSAANICAGNCRSTYDRCVRSIGGQPAP